jgi:hypothetical protein
LKIEHIHRAAGRPEPLDEPATIILIQIGLILLIAGLAQRLQVSAAIGAFLIGIALSEPIAERAHNLLAPLRDLFAAIFFLFFGLQIDPASLPPVLLLAILLGVITALTKILTGWWAVGRAKANRLSIRQSRQIIASTRSDDDGAYSPDGSFIGKLSSNGTPIVIDGLWGISFAPSSAANISPTRLFFAAGPNDEQNGLFGYIDR